MDGTCTIREATPTDAAGFARSQISAWRAAYGATKEDDRFTPPLHELRVVRPAFA
ncbi:hypothetical protein [Arthrobacter sp. NPDC092385]|uniref:hypothetical protein n=1 Tax=Arthrobacter sp. NPDC092385 TaxID=3363943 RepID=UPI0037F33F73